MINALLQGIMNLIMGLVNILLLPIDALIETALPNLSDALNSIGNKSTWNKTVDANNITPTFIKRFENKSPNRAIGSAEPDAKFTMGRI